MAWIVKINLVGEAGYCCYCCVVVTEFGESYATETAYAHFLADDFEVDSVTAEVFEQSVHGDLTDYEILD